MANPRRAVLACLLITSVVAAACTGSPGGIAAPGSSETRASSTRAHDPAQLYVSVGDSYAAGYQPSAAHRGGTTGNGFAYQAVSLAKAKGHDLTLVNFGCSGATTTSALTSAGCESRNLGPGAASYSTPQITAAADYLRAHRGRVALVSVSLGGNDIAPCARSATTSAATSCVTSALSKITANLSSIAARLRSATGPTTKIVGLTYPDIFLGEYLSADTDRRNLANLSVLAFRSLINPQVSAAYAKAGASFADVTAATGAYAPLTRTTALSPYGTIPVAVADVCRLTYYCRYGDIHPTTAGYKIIAGLVVDALPRR